MACLQDFRSMLIDSKCRDEVHKVMARGSEDIRFNQMLSDACLGDREKHCNTTQQVSHPHQLFTLTIMTVKYYLFDSLLKRVSGQFSQLCACMTIMAHNLHP